MEDKERVDLLDFVNSLSGGDGLRVEESLGNGFVRLRIAEAERRQAKHDIRCVEDAVIELLRNSRDAGASKIIIGMAREGNIRTLVIADDGSGIPPELHERVFDARVTSKLDSVHMDRWGVHGRGMALFSIRENARSARVVCSDVGRGCVMQLEFDVSTLAERADQSTWPQVGHAAGKQSIRGPHNIYRTCVEFALEERGRCNVYIGSPSEALATMRSRMGRVPIAGSSLPAIEEVPYAAQPCFVDDSRELSRIALSLGIDISERNAHRVIKGEIAPLQNVVAYVLGTGTATRHHASQDQRKIILSREDERELREQLANVFSTIEERYYVRLVSTPTLRFSAGHLTVGYDYVEED